MTEVERIVDLSQRAFAGDAWHGPPLMTILKNVNATQAVLRPFKNAHSIWELVFHIAAWERAVLKRLVGDRAELSDAEDWPAVSDTSEEAWAQAMETLQAVHQQFQDAISTLDDSRLNQPIVEGLATVYITLHGIIQHTLYHAGQIAILKRAIEEN